jgi:hypothetical protein
VQRPRHRAQEHGVCFRTKYTLFLAASLARVFSVAMKAVESLLDAVLRENALDDLASLSEALWALELAEIDDPADRERLAPALFDLAVKLRDDARARATPTLWSALRRFATVVSASAAEQLLAFLREEDDADARQLALQCVQTVFFLRGAASDEATALTERVRQLHDLYLRADILIDPKMRALAANAAVALSALAPDSAVAIARRVHELARPGVTRLVAQKWRAMVEARANDDARPLREALEVLSP